jgi:protein-tyrosine phosphatase
VAGALLGRELSALGIDVQSAGLLGFNRPPPVEAITAAQRHGVDLSRHRSRLVTADLVRTADIIVVMDVAQRRHVCERFGRRPTDTLILGDFDPESVETRTICDPLNQKLEVFEQVYERIARCVKKFVTILAVAER